MNTDVGTLCGSLLAGIAQARILTDIETVRTAEFYAEHPLLKHMPVPRMRCSEVTLDVPVAIGDVEDLTSGAGLRDLVRRGARVPEDQETDEALDDAIRYSGLTLEPQEVDKLRGALRDRGASLRSAPQGTRVGRRITGELRESLRGPLGELAAARVDEEGAPRKFGKLLSALELGIQERTGEDLQRLNRVRVEARTSELSRLNDPSMVVRLRMTISEEGYELTVGEGEDGGVVETFTPE